MVKEEIEIIKASLRDLEGIYELEKLWEEEKIALQFESIPKEEFEEKMRKYSDYHLIALRKGEIIGYANGIVIKENKNKVFRDGEEYLSVENI